MGGALVRGDMLQYITNNQSSNELVNLRVITLTRNDKNHIISCYHPSHDVIF